MLNELSLHHLRNADLLCGMYSDMADGSAIGYQQPVYTPRQARRLALFGHMNVNSPRHMHLNWFQSFQDAFVPDPLKYDKIQYQVLAIPGVIILLQALSN